MIERDGIFGRGGLAVGLTTRAGRLRRDGGGSDGSTVLAYASADQLVTNSDALTADTALSVSLEASTTYFIEAFLVYTTGANGGVDTDLAGGTATMTNILLNAVAHEGTTLIASSATGLTALTDEIIKDGTNGVTHTVYLMGSVEVNGAGTFAPRFAQNTPGGGGVSVTRKRGSWLRATKLS